MTVDFHTHIFPGGIAAAAVDKLQSAAHIHPFTDGTAAGLRKSMAAAGVDYSVILPVATSPKQVIRINDSAARINERSRETGLISFGCIHPDFPDWREELDRLAALGFAGIKLHPVYQGVDIDDPRYVRILKRAGELGLMVLIHAGLDIGFPGVDRVSPAMLRRAAEAAGSVTLVFAHMGGWRQWDEVEALLPETGAYLDTSFSLGRIVPNGDGFPRTEKELRLMDEAQFLRMARLFGAERLLFGTDSPWGDQRDSVARIKALPLPEADKAAILGENAWRLLHLPDRESA